MSQTTASKWARLQPTLVGWLLLGLACCPVSGVVEGSPTSSSSAGEGSTGGAGGSTGGVGASGTSGGRPGSTGGTSSGAAAGSSSSTSGPSGSTGGVASTAGGATGGSTSAAGGGTSGSTGGGSTSTGGGTTGSTGGAASSGTSSAGGSTGGRCDRPNLTWNGPTANVDGSCLTNLGWFLVEWGSVSGGPYPNVVNVGLPCTPGTPTPCGSGGTVDQLDCAYKLTGFTNGTWYIVTVAVDTQGGQSVPSNEASVAINCPCNGCACTSGSDCPPFQMCDPSTLMCDTNCTGSGCACVTDSQCAGGYTEQSGLGQGQICVGGFCTAGCNAATDCPLDLACDLTNGAPGTCTGGCSGSACACVIDTQCNADDEGVESVCGSNGMCTSGCKTGYNCTSGTACDQSQGFIATCSNPCTSGACSCIFNSQCTDGGVGLGIACLANSGQCGPGCATGDDCAANQGCETSTNTCVSTCATSGNPYGCACISDTQCNAGLTGQGVICNGTNCLPGCNGNADCDGGTCNLTQTPGTCQ